MKELSIKEKAEAYDKALEKARQLCAYPTTKPFISDLQDLFPELAESEDERIRKVLINMFKGYNIQKVGDFTDKEIIAWLDKQGESKKHDVCDNCEQQGNCVSPCCVKLVEKNGEQKPTEWSEEDIKTLERIVCILDGIRYYNTVDSKQEKPYQSEIDWLNSLKEREQPNQEWSEDTQQWIDAIIKDYEGWYDADKDHRATIQVKINILKSLRPQSHWKPSKRQIQSVRNCALNENIDAGTRLTLDALYQDLLKLREE